MKKIVNENHYISPGEIMAKFGIEGDLSSFWVSGNGGGKKGVVGDKRLLITTKREVEVEIN